MHLVKVLDKSYAPEQSPRFIYYLSQDLAQCRQQTVCCKYVWNEWNKRNEIEDEMKSRMIWGHTFWESELRLLQLCKVVFSIPLCCRLC